MKMGIASESPFVVKLSPTRLFLLSSFPLNPVIVNSNLSCNLCKDIFIVWLIHILRNYNHVVFIQLENWKFKSLV